jgi:hypothetical protein
MVSSELPTNNQCQPESTSIARAKAEAITTTPNQPNASVLNPLVAARVGAVKPTPATPST